MTPEQEADMYEALLEAEGLAAIDEAHYPRRDPGQRTNWLPWIASSGEPNDWPDIDPYDWED